MDCLGEDTIIEFLQGGRLSDEETDVVEKHIDECQDCRLLVAELARTSISDDPTPSPPVQSKRSSKPVLYAAADGYVIDPNAFGADDDLTDPELMDERPTFKLRKDDDSGVTLAEELDTDPGYSRTLPPDGTGLQADTSELQPGFVISQRYRIVRFLGAGGMGTVYEAHDEQLDERIALKVLRPELKDIPQLLERLHHEVVLGRRITHPNICRLHDIGEYGDIHFITMELVRGESLDEHLKRGRPAGRLAASLLLQVCNALEAAHQKGVVHRDLKPGNIMIDWTAEPVSIAPGLRSQQQLMQEVGGKVTVMDFGLARDLHGDRSQSGMLIGSPAYWAPEQARGERATEQSDIYAVGVMACELFGGPRPTLAKCGTLSEVPTAYRPVIRRCLQTKPEDRYECAGSLRDALIAAARSAPKRRRVTLAAVSAVVVFIAAIVSYSLLALFENNKGESNEANGVSISKSAAATTPATTAPVVEMSSKKQPAVSLKQTQKDKEDKQPTVEATTEPIKQPKRRSRRSARKRSKAASKIKAQPAATAQPATAQPATAQPATAQPATAQPATAQPATTAPDAGAAKKATEAAAAAKRAADAARAMMITTIRQRAAAVERHRAAKGFLATDLPAYVRQQRKLEAAIKANDGDAAGKAIEQLTLVLSRARIDGPFVSRKLRRLSKQMNARKLRPELAKQVKAIFSKVHARFFKDDYEAANQHLNHLWRLLRK